MRQGWLRGGEMLWKVEGAICFIRLSFMATERRADCSSHIIFSRKVMFRPRRRTSSREPSHVQEFHPSKGLSVFKAPPSTLHVYVGQILRSAGFFFHRQKRRQSDDRDFQSFTQLHSHGSIVSVMSSIGCIIILHGRDVKCGPAIRIMDFGGPAARLP